MSKNKIDSRCKRDTKKQTRGLPYCVSQNFLTSLPTIRRILSLTTIGKDDDVIEIGAGKGHITREIAKRSGMVTAYEIDPKMMEGLKKRLKNLKNIRIINQDFLSAKLPNGGSYKVFSNLPFCITTDIVKRLTTAGNLPREAWLVMEKGAAKRFIGKPKETKFSLLIKPFFTMEVAYYFSRSDFHPMPSVDVVLLHLKKKTNPDIQPSMKKEFSCFVERCLRDGVYSLLSKKQVSTALRLAKLPHIETSGTILYVQWLCLFRCYSSHSK